MLTIKWQQRHDRPNTNGSEFNQAAWFDIFLDTSLEQIFFVLFCFFECVFLSKKHRPPSAKNVRINIVVGAKVGPSGKSQQLTINHMTDE